MSENYVQEIKVGDQLDGPSCHVCGAIMVKAAKGFRCLSCGATTEVS